MDRSYLAQVVRYQAENNVSIATQKQYLCKVKVMTEMLNETTEFREDALITIDGIAIKHTGIAENIYVLKLPMSVDVGEMLFAHISTCENLAKGHRSKRRQHVETIVIDDSVPIDSNDPGANIVTVSAQMFQNYKSALRWWHEYTCEAMDTIGRSDNIDDILTQNMILDLAVLILDLAVFIWCKHPTSTEDAKFVFAGDDQEKRYYHTLVHAVDEEIDPDLDLGCARCDIGTHSNRKFAESTSVSKIDGPSRTQVCLRAGQGVGRTQDCYMFSEDDGDALVGRTVAQLKLNADEFDVLPPHFSTAAMSALNRYGWSRILPSYVHYSEGFQRVIHILFASLVYHFHAGNMHILYDSDHPIFFQDVFFQHQHAG
jgi:hypothetical protein